MPYDTPETGQAKDAPAPVRAVHRRGVLRPPRLASVRSRLHGHAVAMRVRLTDFAALFAIALIGAWPSERRGVAFILIMASVFAAGMLHAFDAYEFRAKESLARHFNRVLGAVGAASLATMAGARLLFAGAPEFDAAVITWCLRVAAVSCAAHLAWFFVVQRIRRRGLLTPNLVIVGATPSAERLVRSALAHREVHILGIFDDRRSRSPRELFGVPMLGSTADLIGHRILPYVDRIILAVPSNATGRISDLLDRLAPIPNPISLLMDAPGAEGGGDGAAAPDMLLDMPLADLSGVRAHWLKAAIKRTLDISLASLALLALAPIFLVIAAAVRLDSRGPIFFRQRRHGLLNEEVVVWKFRTMRVEAQDATARRQVSADDDRITRVGRILRRTSLDELPQLWNVVAGEMSLVGPRPHAIGMMTGGEDSSRLVQTYAYRHRMKPGLTGWAAVNGSRGPVDTPEAVRRRVALDIEYIERQSIWFDLSIILRTLPCLLGDTDAVR